MARIIMFSHVMISGKSKFGPGIRLVEIAKSLQTRGHSVTVAEKNRKKEEVVSTINFIPFIPEILETIDTDYDVCFFQIWFNDKDFLEKIKIPIIFDLYAPYMIEHIYYNYNLRSKDDFWRFYDDIYSSSLIPLRYGDYFLCASDRQRKFYLGMLAACGRINPYNKEKDLIGIVPYGVQQKKQEGKEVVLRKVIPKDKKIILWVSSFYSWLDPVMTARIILELNGLDEDYVLAVVGPKSPFLHESHYNKRYDEFLAFVKEKGMLDKSVFIFDWVEHEKIASIYSESELFILTHFQNLETELSYRVRMMEALWGNLPVICQGGDVVSDMIKENNMGIVLEGANPIESAKKIYMLSKKDKEMMKKNIGLFLKVNTWDKVVSPIDDFCNSPFIDDSKEHFLFKDIIDDRRQLNLVQRKIIDEKEGIIRDLEKGISGLHEKSYYLEKNHQVEVESLRKQLEEKNKVIMDQRDKMGRFRGSIVFGLYRFTSKIGKTGFGEVLQKIFK